MEIKMSFEVKPYEEKMNKCIIAFEGELATVRAGRANPSLLDKVMVDYYGAPTPVNQVGEVKAPDPRTIVVSPWDPSLLKQIEKAIMVADLGLQPQNDGKVIRISIPQLTEETRKDLTKQVAKMSEEGKVAIRNVRREANDKLKAAKKAKEITEDEEKSLEKKIQDLTDKFIKQVDTITEKKNKEIMSI